jgi:hypothetical protein
VLEDLAVEIEEGAVAAQLLQAGIGDFVMGVELIEGLDEKRTAAAGGIEDAQGLERLLPLLPEADEGLALRLIERGEVVGVRDRRAFSSPCRWRRLPR